MKAILVIDMPKACDECPLLLFETETDRCKAFHKQVLVEGEDKPIWCPLKPMPEKLYVEANQIEDVMHTEMNIGNLTAKIILDTDKLIALGWNACLEELDK